MGGSRVFVGPSPPPTYRGSTVPNYYLNNENLIPSTIANFKILNKKCISHNFDIYVQSIHSRTFEIVNFVYLPGNLMTKYWFKVVRLPFLSYSGIDGKKFIIQKILSKFIESMQLQSQGSPQWYRPVYLIFNISYYHHRSKD